MTVNPVPRIRRWAVAVPYRAGLRRCVHPGYTVEYSWLRRRPDGRGRSYDRCSRCRRVAWQSWDQLDFLDWLLLDSAGELRWQAVLIRARAGRDSRGGRG